MAKKPLFKRWPRINIIRTQTLNLAKMSVINMEQLVGGGN